ncbi:hypothetical protein A2422_02970 [Candidatus Woesebacteria bacterium RIFOXYC1_FULL_31_51]|nr:MAG: diacylglycerol kinase, diacylglycerol kinase [Candidatus Woesebacteria bacterium GW2011_GWF1_31_35]KKP23405.1 MAG: Diacylglycerol kinase [Candidatus Woesebacteria bacterium GW2011_GWC1_30_29]KKP25063.1 MAG: Diacylglycerol kinase [Candidatus Woesebacteria bacterium GW2011_GWD1_31_12]KKP27681.1 MAG: Diacylglycerol kinase [Candidatus Woesebacteria bacterium GW2011_GWB1_31_29]KKP33171.1 MAG: Diacylglycerol kinase [Candidatus Woesebacteria bacterium GW2011_GWE2_31_6]KKP34279.1 MAG: Diacylgl
MIKSFLNAFRGVSDAVKSEHNLRIHFLASIIVFVFAYFLKFSPQEFAILTLTVFLVIILELINTMIEKVTDIISPEISERARVIKDISASVVLFGAIASIIVAIFLFVPKIWG